MPDPEADAQTSDARGRDGRILVCSITDRGATLARRLPYEHAHGSLVATVARRWEEVDAFVLVCATGVAVRAIAPHLAGKAGDPAVVCLDDAGQYVIALTGGHRPGARSATTARTDPDGRPPKGDSPAIGNAYPIGGANNLARQVAALVGAEAIVTTATDGAGLPALDTLPGWRAEGDVAGVTRAWLDGARPAVTADDALASWPLPPALRAALATDTQVAEPAEFADPSQADTPDTQVAEPAEFADPSQADTPATRVAEHADPSRADTPATRVRVSDRITESGPGLVVLRPGSLVLGVGASSGADPHRMADLVANSLAATALASASVALVATLDRKATEPAVALLAARYGVAIRTFPAESLAPVAIPNPSPVVAAAVGTPSVAEAAALLAAGPGATLVAEKTATRDSTVAIARRAAPEGHLFVVGLGPGGAAHRTPAATAAVRHAEIVIGYGPYVDQAADLLHAGQLVIRSRIGAEAERCRQALERAAGGETVALVCSGDAGVYGMASLVGELAPAFGSPPVTVVPGVTAGLAAAALLGAPLGHDHLNLSLSDLLTPWELIERRLRAAADADLVVALYNPRSSRRTWQLTSALSILADARPAATPAAVVHEAGRTGERVARTTLGELDPEAVGMLSVVIVGSSTTRWVGTRMVTPRGYHS